MKVLVTGATGFVGSALVKALLKRPEVFVVAACREPGPVCHPKLKWVRVGELGPTTSWREALEGVQIVIHCAAANSAEGGNAAERAQRLYEINAAGTARLASEAVAQGVLRFLYFSTIKVHGETGGPYTESNPHNPISPYAVSKSAAESKLTKICHETGMEYVIIRPPLVYGPGVKGNFRMLMRWANSSVPILINRIQNKRSMIYLDNMVQFTELSMQHPAAANQSFLVSDGADFSTAQILIRLRELYGRTPLRWSLPRAVFQLATALPGLNSIVDRIASSLTLDSSKSQQVLGWKPAVTGFKGFEETLVIEKTVTKERH